MRNLLTALALAAALLFPGPGRAQNASPAEMRAVQEIVECMLEGLPPDWERAQMVIELRKPMDLTGRVFYLMSTDDDGDDFVPFQPCDSGRPADLLIEARALLPRDRRGWTGAILLIQRDGRFGLNYDYP